MAMEERHAKLCYYCGKPCNSVAGNPAEWPIPINHKDEPGKVKYHHMSCVSQRLQQLEDANKLILRAGHLIIDLYEDSESVESIHEKAEALARDIDKYVRAHGMAMDMH